MTAYYNEKDPYAAEWLRRLISAGHIAPGDVDERSITDVRADDLRGYKQCHFFAGIGIWSLALRLAGWPDDRFVWSGSCPCQPFSAAGAGKAADDERHLWPKWFPLIAECRPAIVFGEQVEAAIGWGWLDAVFADLEAEGYACGAAVLPACGVGAPHIRQRLWFVANADGQREGSQRGISTLGGEPVGSSGELADASGERQRADELGRDSREGKFVARSRSWGDRRDDGATGELADAQGSDGRLSEWPQRRTDTEFAGSGEARELADADGWDASTEWLQRGGEYGQQLQDDRTHLLADAMQPAGERRTGSVPRAQEALGGQGEQDGRFAHRPPDGGEACTMADAAIPGRPEQPQRHAGTHGRSPAQSRRLRDAHGMADAAGERRRRQQPAGAPGATEGRKADAGRSAGPEPTGRGRMGDASEPGLSSRQRGELPGPQPLEEGRAIEQPGRSPWSDVIWLPCTDGKARPIKPGIFPLADARGPWSRVAVLRAAGNAIVAEAAAQFIIAATEDLT